MGIGTTGRAEKVSPNCFGICTQFKAGLGFQGGLLDGGPHICYGSTWKLIPHFDFYGVLDTPQAEMEPYILRT